MISKRKKASMLSPLPTDPDPIYDEHARLKAVRERMNEVLEDSISRIRDNFPGEERVLADLLDGHRDSLMRVAHDQRLAVPR